MAICFLWATLLTSEVSDRVISSLVHRGYTVSPLSRDKKTRIIGQASALLALRVDGVEKMDKSEAQDVLMSALKETLKDYSYFSLVVFQTGGNFTWEGSNIELPKESTGKTALARVAGESPLDDET